MVDSQTGQRIQNVPNNVMEVHKAEPDLVQNLHQQTQERNAQELHLKLSNAMRMCVG